jgi:hypothetical protein
MPVTAHRGPVGWPATLSRARDAGSEPGGGTGSVICATGWSPPADVTERATSQLGDLRHLPMLLGAVKGELVVG